MNGPNSKVAFVESKGYCLRNATWSWGATGPEGILLLLSNESQYNQWLGGGQMLCWLCGGHPSDTTPGGVERMEHVAAIGAGERGRAAFYTPAFDAKGKERIGTIAPDLWRVVHVLPADAQGRVWARLENERKQ